MEESGEKVWIFHGAGGRFASAVFSDLAIAEKWINGYRLSGVLTEYRLNEGAYDTAIADSSFNVKKAEHRSPEFIQKFTSGSQEHYHYKDGERES